MTHRTAKDRAQEVIRDVNFSLIKILEEQITWAEASTRLRTLEEAACVLDGMGTRKGDDHAECIRALKYKKED